MSAEPETGAELTTFSETCQLLFPASVSHNIMQMARMMMSPHQEYFRIRSSASSRATGLQVCQSELSRMPGTGSMPDPNAKTLHFTARMRKKASFFGETMRCQL